MALAFYNLKVISYDERTKKDVEIDRGYVDVLAIKGTWQQEGNYYVNWVPMGRERITQQTFNDIIALDIFTGGGGGGQPTVITSPLGSINVGGSGTYGVRLDSKISAEAGNNLSLKSDGLYAASSTTTDKYATSVENTMSYGVFKTNITMNDGQVLTSSDLTIPDNNTYPTNLSAAVHGQDLQIDIAQNDATKNLTTTVTLPSGEGTTSFMDKVVQMDVIQESATEWHFYLSINAVAPIPYWVYVVNRNTGIWTNKYEFTYDPDTLRYTVDVPYTGDTTAIYVAVSTENIVSGQVLDVNQVVLWKKINFIAPSGSSSFNDLIIQDIRDTSHDTEGKPLEVLRKLWLKGNTTTTYYSYIVDFGSGDVVSKLTSSYIASLNITEYTTKLTPLINQGFMLIEGVDIQVGDSVMTYLDKIRFADMGDADGVPVKDFDDYIGWHVNDNGFVEAMVRGDYYTSSSHTVSLYIKHADSSESFVSPVYNQADNITYFTTNLELDQVSELWLTYSKELPFDLTQVVHKIYSAAASFTPNLQQVLNAGNLAIGTGIVLRKTQGANDQELILGQDGSIQATVKNESIAGDNGALVHSAEFTQIYQRDTTNETMLSVQKDVGTLEAVNTASGDGAKVQVYPNGDLKLSGTALTWNGQPIGSGGTSDYDSLTNKPFNESHTNFEERINNKVDEIVHYEQYFTEVVNSGRDITLEVDHNSVFSSDFRLTENDATLSFANRNTLSDDSIITKKDLGSIVTPNDGVTTLQTSGGETVGTWSANQSNNQTIYLPVDLHLNSVNMKVTDNVLEWTGTMNDGTTQATANVELPSGSGTTPNLQQVLDQGSSAILHGPKEVEIICENASQDGDAGLSLNGISGAELSYSYAAQTNPGIIQMNKINIGQGFIELDAKQEVPSPTDANLRIADDGSISMKGTSLTFNGNPLPDTKPTELNHSLSADGQFSSQLKLSDDTSITSNKVNIPITKLYHHQINLEFKDSQGNIHEGRISLYSTSSKALAQQDLGQYVGISFHWDNEGDAHDKLITTLELTGTSDAKIDFFTIVSGALYHDIDDVSFGDVSDTVKEM